MRRTSSILVACVALLLVHAGPAKAQVPFDLIRHTEATSFGPPAGPRLVRSPAELAAAWRDMGRRDTPPVVDFDRNSAVFYYAGLKPSTGYTVEVERVGIQRGVMEIAVVLTEPGAGCGNPQSGTSPAVAIRTIPWKGEVTATVRRIVHDCN